jgi:selenocysteine lyase/cysteine desulfurase
MNRRQAIQHLAAAAAVCGLPLRSAFAAQAGPSAGAFKLPDPNSKDFWHRLRAEQFLLPEGRAFLNNGSLGVTPRPVLQAVVQFIERAAEYATDDVPRWGYETLDEDRAEMGAFLGCSKDELAFTHNCTEAMNFIANGLDLKSGDEVIITNQEHTGGSACWRLKAARHGIRLREVEIPLTPKEPGDITERLISAIGPDTRVLSFSGIATHTGLILPVAEICRAARAKGVLTVLDAAHMNGQVPFNLRELGCDFCAGSPHKWMFAPAGCGYLFGRTELLEQLWSTVASASWERGKGSNATRFMMVGTNNRATLAGMMAGLRFIRELGQDRIFRRMHELTDRLIEHASRRNYLDLITPRDRRFFQAMVTVLFKTENVQPVMDALKAKNINVLGGRRLRLSCHVHTRPEDIDLLFSTFDEVQGKEG